MPGFLPLFHDPEKGHSLLHPPFVNWWEGVSSVVSGHSAALFPLDLQDQVRPGHSLPYVGGHRRPRLAALPAAPDEGAEGTGCHHAQQGTLT